jgi:hypothetical protein
MPLWDEIIQGTTHSVTERNPTIHATSCLVDKRLFRKRDVDFKMILDALVNGTIVYILTPIFQKSVMAIHQTPLRQQWSQKYR